MRLSPSATRVAWVDGLGERPSNPTVKVVTPTANFVVGDGQSPHWLNEETIVYNSQSGRLMRAMSPTWKPIDIGLGGNWIAAGGNRWAAARTDPVRTFTSESQVFPGYVSPALSFRGDLVLVHYETSTIFWGAVNFGVGSLPRFGGLYLGWEDLQGGIKTVDISTVISGVSLLKPVPVDIPTVGLCFLCHDQVGRILLVKENTTTGVVLGMSDGSAYTHDAAVLGGVLRTIWYSPDGKLIDTGWEIDRLSWTTIAPAKPQPYGVSAGPKYLGYFYDHGKYGEFSTPCNMTVIGKGMYKDGDGNYPANWEELIDNASHLTGCLMLAGDALSPRYWPRVHRVWTGELGDPSAIRAEVAALRTQMKPLGQRKVVATLMPHQTTDPSYRGVADEAAVEVYFETPAVTWDEQVKHVTSRVSQILTTLDMPLHLIVQSYDRRPNFPLWAQRSDMIEAIQQACQECLVNPRIVGLWWFAYARPGGVLDYPQLKPWHVEQVKVTTRPVFVPVPPIPPKPKPPEPPMADHAACSYPIPQDVILGALERFKNETCLDKDKAVGPGGETLSLGVFMFFINFYVPEMTKKQSANGIPGDGNVWASWSGQALDKVKAEYKKANPEHFQ
jgi:hypothetical protein